MTGGVVIYNSYGEWLDSPYSDPQTGQTCQDCHMPTVDYDYIVFPERGGMKRGGDKIHNHKMPGAYDEKFLQNSVTMTTTARSEGGQVVVDVSITNDKTRSPGNGLRVSARSETTNDNAAVTNRRPAGGVRSQSMDGSYCLSLY